MQKTLEELYLGDISPWEKRITIDGYVQECNVLYTNIDDLEHELSPKHKDLFEKITAGFQMANTYEATQAFVDGFKLAIRLMAESLI